MPNFAGVLKAEIRRLARKEVRASVVPLRKLVATMRRRMAEQRKLIVEMERAAKRSIAQVQTGTAAEGPAGAQIRFSSQWVRAHRKRLRMSRREYAKLVGVSAQSIFGWETGRTRPRRRALEAWRRLRSMGMREIRQMPGEGEAAGRGRRGRGVAPARRKRRGRRAAAKRRRGAAAAARRGRPRRGRRLAGRTARAAKKK